MNVYTISLFAYIRIENIRNETSYQYDDGYRTGKAPDEFVIDGDPTEVWVPVSLWVQAHSQACRRHTQSDQTQQEVAACNQLSDSSRTAQRRNRTYPNSR